MYLSQIDKVFQVLFFVHFNACSCTKYLIIVFWSHKNNSFNKVCFPHWVGGQHCPRECLLHMDTGQLLQEGSNALNPLPSAPGSVSHIWPAGGKHSSGARAVRLRWEGSCSRVQCTVLVYAARYTVHCTQCTILGGTVYAALCIVYSVQWWVRFI